ncbi:AarF/ABC1/UbiB kinase family protein [Clostridium sp. PL3]|uniref:AarF/ABC1/UbiB kinase family protein n=1 Tax=Clostridium thailandense TaxID=2794346 RepID=A0A949U2C0_9CLOT|nr:AarF/ABC1/UbiB kinase family protein [Clostridium thailandense]MBV7276115.1 AarF/ABC1/UbiB kinase family protein [Clostridium thailandense]
MYSSSLERFREIISVLARYGFDHIIDKKMKKQNIPHNLRKAFEELGPTFIKIGQILSTRPDILPPEYIEELSHLQDNASPESYENINNVFFSVFHKNLDDCFLHFQKKPLASASIAQVHNAVLKNGREVIVKIQRPEIKEKIKMDLSILHRIIKLTKTRFSDSLIDPEEALTELMESTEQELDFKIEALNIKKFRDLNNTVAFCYTPYVIDELSSIKVLTMEKIYGFKINDFDKLKEGGYDLQDLGKKLVLSFFKQVFTDGFFHGDPHPGNLLINGGKICFIDFGIMGSLSDSLKASLNDAIVSVAFKDLDKLVSIIMSIGIKKGFVNKNKLYEDVEYLFSRYVYSSLKNIHVSTLLQEIFNCAKNNNIKLPKDLILLVRSLVIIEGVTAKIAPDIQILDIAIPFVKNNSKLSLLEKVNLDDILMYFYNFTKDLSRIPSRFIEIINTMLNGRLKIQIQINNLDKHMKSINKMVNRLILALIICSTIIGSSLILKTNIGPKIYGFSAVGLIGIMLSSFMSLILLIFIIKSNNL